MRVRTRLLVPIHCCADCAVFTPGAAAAKWGVLGLPAAPGTGYDLPLPSEVLRIDRIRDLGFWSQLWSLHGEMDVLHQMAHTGAVKSAPSREGTRTTSQAKARRPTYGCTEGHVAERRAEASQSDDSGEAE